MFEIKKTKNTVSNNVFIYPLLLISNSFYSHFFVCLYENLRLYIWPGELQFHFIIYHEIRREYDSFTNHVILLLKINERDGQLVCLMATDSSAHNNTLSNTSDVRITIKTVVPLPQDFAKESNHRNKVEKLVGYGDSLG